MFTYGAAMADPLKASVELDLRQLTESLKLTEEETVRLKSQVTAIKADRAELTRRLIDTADKIKAGEAQIEAAETRLEQLNDQEEIIRASLRSRRAALAEILAALQRLGRTPPPALVVRPQDALAAIRSAMLMGAVVPELRVTAQKLASDLTELMNLREQIGAEKERLAVSTRALAGERVRIEALIESKRSNLAATLAEFEEARRQADKLAGETQSLQVLISRMDEKIKPEAEAEGRSDMEPALQRAALTDPGRIRPAMSFAAAKGLLPLPVNGSMVSQFGEANGFDSTTRGVAIATRASAQVTSPSDGWVVFAGNFRSYGQLLIINVGGGYHVLLAGLQRISVGLGQFVLAGEPVGTMGEGAAFGHSFAGSGASDRPVLYVEFRKDGISIDPTPWWASAEERVRG
ncbi:MAG: peptidoglycan DD-metalloendopeptidase family protein [Hyphomicrobiales bacterium]|nr:peptidoglycan DD-metalloendopeptidase family protein [Hyphomicrobiales bacterium]